MTTSEEPPIDVAPFELLGQKEQWDHLSRFHRTYGSRSNGLNSKSRKSAMEAFHAESHLTGSFILRPHTHTATASPISTSGGLPADVTPLDLDKPLNASQRKALKDLVDNDFLALRAEIQQMADDMAAQRRTEITQDWHDRGIDANDYTRRAHELATHYRNDRDALIIEAREKGVTLKLPELETYKGVEASVEGLKTAIKAAEAEVDADRKRALNSLERARLTAQKQVLMAGVDQQALELLGTIPNARDLMLQAATQRSAFQAIESSVPR